MPPGALAKLSRRSLFLGLGVATFIAAFVWLLAARGPLAPVGVETAAVTRADLQQAVYGIGTVEAQHAYAVGPIQAGRVLRVLVDHGDAVQADQLLAEIDPIDLVPRVDAAASAAARARQAERAATALVSEAESRARIAQANAERYQALRRQNFVAQEMADSRSHEAAAALGALAAARANAAAAQREVSRADAELQGLHELRNSLKLLSPIDGVVTAREAEPGTTVVAGQAVLRLVDPTRVWVRARVDQARAEGVTAGQPAEITLRSRPGVALTGKVARIELQSDALTEERIVNVAFDPAPPQLYLGELAEVSIRLSGALDAMTLPRAAVTQHKGQAGVWRIEQGRARFQPVQPGVRTDGQVQVVSGLEAGDRVIAYSARQLEDGVRVREQQLTPR
jgi:HlyD family secretion protein